MRGTGSVGRISAPERTALDRAFDLATRGPAHGPNPRVGCVLIDAAGRVLGEGWHAGAGTAHAEAAAVAAATDAGHDLAGATAVVTLEPCAHTGRTPACAQLLIAAGIGRVVHAVADPNPVAGGGSHALTAAGIDVVGDVDPERAGALLEVWLHAVRSGRPFVTVKIAMSADGRVAAADGTSRWITSPHARAHGHRIRAEVDAIAVGTGTAIADRPTLSARRPDGSPYAHQPLRVVVGRRPADLAGGAGGEVLRLGTHDPATVLGALAEREIRHLLVEGGPTLASAFLRSGFVDRIHLYVAPVLLGAGTAALGEIGVATLTDAPRFAWEHLEMIGPDALLVGRPAPEMRS